MRLLISGVTGVTQAHDERVCSLDGRPGPAHQGKARGRHAQATTSSAKFANSSDRHAGRRAHRGARASGQNERPLRWAMPPERSEARTGAPSRAPRDRLCLFATALSVWSALYVLPHAYWAVGGDLGFSALKPSATSHEAWQAINAAASVILLLPVAIGLALPRARAHRVARAVLLTACLGGASIAASHGVYGIIYRVLNIVGVVDVDGRRFTPEQHAWALWDLFLFEPWFLIEGLFFVGAGWASMSKPGSRSRWLLGCLVGISLAVTTGALGLRIG